MESSATLLTLWRLRYEINSFQRHGEAWRSHADYIDRQAARWQAALLA
jgi:hypothetical protein